MRTYNAGKEVAKLPPRPPLERQITKDTKLVCVEDAAVAIKAEKGLDISVKVIRQYCNSRKWKEGIHWVKPMKRYLINLDAVYEWIASGGVS